MSGRTARFAPARRTRAEWGVRGAIAVGAFLFGSAAVTHALGYSLRTTDPETAYALSPGNGQVGALFSEFLSGANADVPTRERADRIARRALRYDPTATSAVATLGIDAQIRGDTQAARRIFAYSDKLSRRDLRTRLWAIEDAVGRNDIPAALQSYDTALRTSRFAPTLLYPVLNDAIANVAVADAMVSVLAKRPPWHADFLNQAALGKNPAAAAALLRKLHHAGVAVPGSADTMTIDALVNANDYESAWAHYGDITGADRRRSRDPHFTADPASPSSFDWKPILDDPGVTGIIRRGGFDYSVSPMSGGTILQQTQMLSPGHYILSGRATGIASASGGSGRWVVRCTDGRELIRIPLSGSAEESPFAGRFSVPAGCPVQYLRLMIEGNGLSSDLSGQLSEAQIRPLS